MGRATEHIARSARWWLVLTAATGLPLLAAVPAAAADEPIISEGTAREVGGEIIVGAQINPEGLETSYEILLECLDDEPCQVTEGTLPAIDEARAVHLTLTAPQPGATYLFTVTARNADGKASASWRFQAPSPPTQEIPPGSAPNGSKVTETYTPPEHPWANQSGNEAAARTVAEQRTKEQEEQQAKEAAARRAAELKHTEEQTQQAQAEAAARQREEAEHPACRVPALKGDTLTAASRALRRAHCRLGAIHRPAHHHGTLYVSAQGAPAGKQLAGGARVMLTLGVKQSAAKRLHAGH